MGLIRPISAPMDHMGPDKPNGHHTIVFLKMGYNNGQAGALGLFRFRFIWSHLGFLLFGTYFGYVFGVLLGAPVIWSPFVALFILYLGPIWDPCCLGPIWDPFGPIWGPFWTHLGPFWLGPILGPFGPSLLSPVGWLLVRFMLSLHNHSMGEIKIGLRPPYLSALVHEVLQQGVSCDSVFVG